MSFYPETCDISVRSPSKSKNRVTRFVLSLLGRYLPRKTKRLIFLSTFFASSTNVCNPSKDLLAKMNKLLRISNIDEAIALPMLFGCRMWHSKLPDGVYLQHLKNPSVQITELKHKDLNPAELRITANTILSCSPRWLMYDSKRIMRADIVLLLSSLPELDTVS